MKLETVCCDDLDNVWRVNDSISNLSFELICNGYSLSGSDTTTYIIILKIVIVTL